MDKDKWLQDTPATVDNDAAGKQSKTAVPLAEKIPQLLRLAGGGALVFALYSFLVQGWDASNDIYRFLFLLGHTGIMAALALMAGHYLKETKGPRLLLTLSLVSVPVIFSILGAFIYSQAGHLVDYPQYVKWSVDSLSTALMTTAGSMLVVVPVTLIGFTVLSRAMSKKLSLLFLVSNAMLLIPLRDAEVVGMLVLALAGMNIWLSRMISHNQLSARTSDGLVSLGLQFLPLAILMGRSLWLYKMDLFLLTIASATAFVLLRQASIYLRSFTIASSWINRLSVLPAVAMTPLLYAAFEQSHMFSASMMLPVAVMATSGMLFDIGRRHHNGFFYQNLSAAFVTLALLYNMAVFETVSSAIVASLAGVWLIINSFRMKEKSVLIYGSLLFVSGTAKVVIEMIQHFDFSGWLSLTSMGIVCILAASVLESQSGRLKGLLNKYQATFRK